MLINEINAEYDPSSNQEPFKFDRSGTPYDSTEDGHGESYPSTEKTAEEYLKDGATEVFTFGPCLVKDGKLTEYALNLCNKSYHPRLAIGVAEDGHYIVVMCEGRVERSKGVQMATLAKLMLDRGCTLAVNMDGGQSASVAFPCAVSILT